MTNNQYVGMKAALKFISWYAACCLVVIVVLYWLKFFSVEIFSYLLWFYVEEWLLGLIIYPLINRGVERLRSGYLLKILMDSVIVILLLNIPFLIADNRILTVDLVKRIGGGVDLHDNINLLIHIISLSCMIGVSTVTRRVVVVE